MTALHAEWTKFRTVRGWTVAAVGAVLASVLFLLAGTTAGDEHPQGAPLAVGPDGEAVEDSAYFVHRELPGDGTVTVSVTALTGLLADPVGGPGAPPTAGVTPWSKAGILVRQRLDRGSAYAAVASTGAHGVRMQYDFAHDVAGLPGSPSAAAPHWLRLVRAGADVTGYDSADGVRWTALGTARLPDPTAAVQVGLFVAAPAAVRSEGGGGSTPATATGRFGQVALDGAWASAGGAWDGTQLGGDAGGSGSYAPGTAGGWTAGADGYTVTGAGDLAPAVGGPGGGPVFTVETSLIGTFVGLIVLTVIAVQFVTVEYRRGLLGTTFAATPRRGRVLAAKGAVVAPVGFAVGTGFAGLCVPLGELRAHATHFTVFTVPSEVRWRAVLGTGLLLALTALLALAAGTLLRRGATAITAVVAATVLPYLLGVGGLLPAGPADWLLRLSPAAGFAVQQTLPRYDQVLSVYTPANGYFPLGPWTGLAVLAAWTLLAVTAAATALHRRDA